MAIILCVAFPLNGCTQSGNEQSTSGIKPDEIVSITSIDLTEQNESTFIYTISYSDGTTATFMIINMQNGNQIIQGIENEDEYTPQVEISSDGYWVVDGEKTEFKALIATIVSIDLTEQNESTFIYTISYSDGTTSMFIVFYAQDGNQTIQGIENEDGYTPQVEISSDGYWVVDGKKTEIKALNEPVYEKGEIIEGWDPELEYEGDLDVFMFVSGQEGTWRDAGSDRYVASDIVDGSQALFFAAAREFKKIYPNININVIGIHVSSFYANELENYIESHNRPPHIIRHLSNVPSQLETGLIADYSKYTDNFPLYDYISEDLLQYFNYGGFQAALPYGVFPMGIYLNTHLVESNFMEVPEPTAQEWTLEALDEIISATPTGQNGRAGVVQLSRNLVNFVAPTIYKNYINGKDIDLDTQEVIRILELENKWAQNNVWFVPTTNGFITQHPNNTQWNVWEMGSLFNSDAAIVNLDNSNSMEYYSQLAQQEGTEDHFDYYPYPAIDEDGELTLGAMFGALTIGNQCPLNATGQESCTEEQRQAEEAAAYFATFMVSDPRSIKAAAEIEWTKSTGTGTSIVKGAINGFSVLKNVDENGQPYALPSSDEGVTDEYQTQMQYFYDTCPTYTDEKPGMAKVVEMYGEGDYPMVIPTATGGTQSVFEEWDESYYYDAAAGSTTWVSAVQAQLSTWSENINSLAEFGWTYLEAQMRSYYNLPEDWNVREKIL